jgi:hypothetical protein
VRSGLPRTSGFDRAHQLADEFSDIGPDAKPRVGIDCQQPLTKKFGGRIVNRRAWMQGASGMLHIVGDHFFSWQGYQKQATVCNIRTAAMAATYLA